MAREPNVVVPFLMRDGAEAAVRKKKSNHRKPKAHEKKVATALGGRKQPGSGAFDDKADVQKHGGGFPLLVECKRTSGQKSIRLEAEWLSKVTQEAHARGSYPALSIQFDDEIMNKMQGLPEATWVALPMSVLRGLLEAAGEVVDL